MNHDKAFISAFSILLQYSSRIIYSETVSFLALLMRGLYHKKCFHSPDEKVMSCVSG